MADIKVYQIGLGNFGRHGFEKFIEMQKYLQNVDVEMKGLVDLDYDRRTAAKKFAKANGIEIDTFDSVDDFYQAAAKEEDTVLVYDASPSKSHAENIYSSVNHGLFHLAEKPPSMTRDENIQERKLATHSDVFWKVDFIERESPVVKKATEILQDETIDSIEVYRESSVGLQKLINPVGRQGVVGGDILDKMTHEIFIYDFLRAAGNEESINFEDGNADFFMPKNLSSDKMMDIYGGSTREIDNETATGMTKARFSAGETEIRLNSSWMGCSHETEKWNKDIEPELIETKFNTEMQHGFVSQEARFFVVNGSRNLLGDMLHGRLLDLDSRELIQTPDLMHDQLYRVLRRAVEHAAEHRESNPDAEMIDEFMTEIFDARDFVTGKSLDFFEQLEKANDHVKQMTEDGKIIEDLDSEQITG